MGGERCACDASHASSGQQAGPVARSQGGTHKPRQRPATCPGRQLSQPPCVHPARRPRVGVAGSARRATLPGTGLWHACRPPLACARARPPPLLDCSRRPNSPNDAKPPQSRRPLWQPVQPRWALPDNRRATAVQPGMMAHQETRWIPHPTPQPPYGHTGIRQRKHAGEVRQQCPGPTNRRHARAALRWAGALLRPGTLPAVPSCARAPQPFSIVVSGQQPGPLARVPTPQRCTIRHVSVGRVLDSCSPSITPHVQHSPQLTACHGRAPEAAAEVARRASGDGAALLHGLVHARRQAGPTSSPGIP